MVQSIAEDRAHRCNGTLALHVLEVMERSIAAAASGKVQRISTRCERPAPLDHKLF